MSAPESPTASAQLAAPGWVRARAIAVYQLSFFGVMALGSALAGWLGGQFSVPLALGAAAAVGAVAAVAVRRWRIASVAPTETPAGRLLSDQGW